MGRGLWGARVVKMGVVGSRCLGANWSEISDWERRTGRTFFVASHCWDTKWIRVSRIFHQAVDEESVDARAEVVFSQCLCAR
jgi:hypothetical protein